MNKLILLAEDSVDDEIFFKRILQTSGIANPIVVVRTGDEVIAYLKAEVPFSDRQVYPFPRVLFLDLVMPGGDGWEVLKWIKAHPEIGKMLIIVLTGPSQRSRLREAYMHGANSFLLKPFDRAELDGLLEMWPDAWMLPSPNHRLPPTSSLGDSASPPA